ncbi:MAG: T9SS type A sorting domain-containing protein, partial [Flavobacteriales bacterium]|nr:T9SS type A sorting domain-containing protein [Flavobacteriales bacterium]
ISAQDPTVEWIHNYDGPLATFDEAMVGALHPAGENLVVAGKGWDTEGGQNVFIIRYTTDGDTLWTYTWDGPESKDDTPYDLAITPNGIIYVCGQTRTGDGYWDSDAFLLALDSDGNLLWEDVYGTLGVYLDIYYELRVAYDEGVFVAGQENIGENAADVGLMQRYNSSGDVTWSVHYDVSSVYPYTDTFRALEVDSEANAIMGGAVTNAGTDYDWITVSYAESTGNQNWAMSNPGNLSGVAESVYDLITGDANDVYALGQNSMGLYEVVKYDVDGIFQWSYELEGFSIYSMQGNDYMHVDYEGNLYFAVTGNADIVVTKLDPDGNQVWQQVWNGPMNLNDEVWQMTSDFFGNLYIAGRSGFSNNYYDMIMLSYDPDGNLLWDVNFDGPATNNDEAHGIVVSPYGNNIYLLGYARGFITSNADLTVVKYSQVTPVVETTPSELILFPNPTSEQCQLQWNGTGPCVLRVYGGNGELVIEREVRGSSHLLDVSNLSDGIYNIVIIGKGSTFSDRLVVE